MMNCFFALAHARFIQNDTLQKVIPALENVALQEPPAVEFHFETIGWKILLVLVVLGVITGFLLWLKSYIKNSYRREALKELAKRESKGITVHDIFIILKIVAIKAFGRENAGHLYGKEWLTFLDQNGKGTNMTQFETPIYDAVYKDMTVDDTTLQEILTNSKQWIKNHAGKL